MPEDIRSATQTDGLISIPDKKYVPEPEKKPKHLRKIKNFADNKETVEKTLVWVQSYFDRFKAQGQRDEFEDSMDVADEMYRATTDRTMLDTKEPKNAEATQSSIHSATYYSDIRAITANEKAISLGNEEQLPIKFEPLPGSTEYSEDEGKRIAEYQNMLLTYTWEVAKIDRAVGRALLFLNKYANKPIEMMWVRKIEDRWIKKPVFERKFFGLGPEDRSKVKTVKWEKETVIVKDWPELIERDAKDVWLDSEIDDDQEQSCIIRRTQKQLDYIWGMQRVNEYINVGDITIANCYQGEGVANDVKAERQTNAGESEDANSPTTLFDVWMIWIRLPVDENGKWDEKKVLPHWHEVTFIGELSNKPICVQLRPLPYSCGLLPFAMCHALEDDKGAYHLGYQDLVKSHIIEEMTLLDMANDNVRLRNRVPLLVERESLLTRNLVFHEGGNQMIIYKAGSTPPKELQIQETTNIIVPMLREMDTRREKIMGTNKAFMGEPIGGRQSASGYLGTLDQALKPAVEDAKFKTDQILPFVGFWIAEMWNDFGDPERSIFVTYEGEQKEVKPKNIWGSLRIRLTSVKNFQDSALRRKEMNELVAQVLPVLISTQAIDAQGIKILAKQILADRHITDVDGILRTTGDFDAIHVARSENMAIVWNGVYDMPKPEENHITHLAEHEPYLGTVALLPEGSQPLPENMNRMKQHIILHKKFMEQGQMGGGMGEQPNLQGTAPTTPGEAMGDQIAGPMGNMGNAPTVETGRPPEYQGQTMGAIQ